ncbi:MAG: methionine gamma-lyase family protein [Oscillospiraceae bacterium]|nr:methionine gamma-lyase family protein [Oscillospiraceae bacterium]
MSNLHTLAIKAEQLAKPYFDVSDAVSETCTANILAAFKRNRVSDSIFAGTTGYGYDDTGRDILERVYADVFGAESALVRMDFVNGTHAIACALFAALAPGDLLVSLTGSPYDTLRGVIGVGSPPKWGSLAFYGVKYAELNILDQLELTAPDAELIRSARTVYIQRGRGYNDRRAISVDEIAEAIAQVKCLNPNAVVIVDNCYGEFVEAREPTSVGADLVAGSLIKNPGGGLAPRGGYVIGRTELVSRASERLTVPGIGGECGATLGYNRLLFQGLFNAPHATAQALKTAAFAAALFELLGYKVAPRYSDVRRDIIQTIELGSPELLKRFCKGLQSGSPIDSFAAPEPWAMPGYDCDVIMAAGTFVQGASIELSADAPLREPYRVFLQGGLTYESGKYGILSAASELLSS